MGEVKLPTNLLRYGSEANLPEAIPLRAGPLEMVFEAGDLRYIKLAGREVIRRIYAAVRDQNWATIPGEISQLHIADHGETFEISYLSAHRRGLIDFSWRARIRGYAAGQIVFEFDGEAHSQFLRNRIGICLLHPADAAGRTCVVTHADGRITKGEFPRNIDPQAPFADIRSLNYEASPGLWISAEFAGDVFEMEDQRNWLDASFKIFCTPLRLPFPVAVNPGERIAQSVCVNVQAPILQSSVSGRGPVTLRLADTPLHPLPALGFGLSDTAQDLSAVEVERLKALRPAFLRFDWPLGRSAPADDWRNAVRQSQLLAAPLEIALRFDQDPEGELRTLENIFGVAPATVIRWLILHRRSKTPSDSLIALAAPRLRQLGLRAEIVAGADAYFTELNRFRPNTSALDGLCYSVNPQVHAFDNASLAETLETFGMTVASARSFANGKAVVVSPVTLRPRFNPDATAPETPPRPGELPRHADPRQMSLFGGGWTIGALKGLTEAGAHSMTFYETVGPLGFMDRAADSNAPQLCPALVGGVFPMYHVFRALAEFGHCAVVSSSSDNSLAVTTLAMQRAGELLLLVANLTNAMQVVRIEGRFVRPLIRKLDETTAFRAALNPEEFRAEAFRPIDDVIELLPYAIAEIRAARV